MLGHVLLYPRLNLGILSRAQVVSLPAGMTEVKPTTASVSSQAAVGVASSGVEGVDLFGLSEQEQGEVYALLQKYQTVFAAHEGDLGCTNLS